MQDSNNRRARAGFAGFIKRNSVNGNPNGQANDVRFCEKLRLWRGVDDHIGIAFDSTHRVQSFFVDSMVDGDVTISRKRN